MSRTWFRFITGAFALLICAPAVQAGQEWIQPDTGYPYLLHLPSDYEESNKEYPLMLFLHGAGERGNNPEQLAKHGPPKLLNATSQAASPTPDIFDMIVVSPQCPAESWWKSGQVKVVLDRVRAEYRVDESRIYCTGLSMGGFGTWTLVSKHPALFAAAAPICGGGNAYARLQGRLGTSPDEVANAENLTSVPIWAFHGAKDQVVPVELSIEMVEKVRDEGGEVLLTIYPFAGHDSWTQTYESPMIYDWLLSHSK